MPLHVQVFAKFDTSEEKLEPLSAELQVKALPVFKFYKVGLGGGGAGAGAGGG